LRKFDQVAAAVKNVAGIFHQGARPSVIRSMKEPQISDAINVNGTINVIKAASDEGVRRIVFASSSSIYGDTPELPKDEAKHAPNPISPYGLQKLIGEQYARIARLLEKPV